MLPKTTFLAISKPFVQAVSLMSLNIDDEFEERNFRDFKYKPNSSSWQRFASYRIILLHFHSNSLHDLSQL